MNIEVTAGKLSDALASQEVATRCPTCNGSRVWRSTVGGGYNMKCPTCKGVGYLTAPEAAARGLITARKADKAAAWREVNPAAAAWIEEYRAGNSFAAAMAANLQRFGSLTDNMLGAIMRNIERAAAPAAVKPQVSMPAIGAAFERAKAAGIKFPKVNMGEFKMSPAPATGTNAGAIYVKSREGTYLGKVLGGVFSRSRDCTAALEASIVDFARDPKAAAEAYGKKYGVCCICSRELSDPESVARGIGPICATRMGW